MAVLLGWTAACSETSPDLTVPEDGTAQVTLALANAPSDVACIVIKIAAAQTVERRFPISGPNSTFTLVRLPVGFSVFTVDAFRNCSPLTATSVPSWVGGPVTRRLTEGPNDNLTIPMRRSGQLDVDVDFSMPAPPNMCMPGGWACSQNTQCCSQRCILGAPETGVGTCAAPVVSDADIRVPMNGGSQYLFYPLDGGRDHCPTGAGGKIYTVAFTLEEERCLPSPEFDGAVAVVLPQVNICEVGRGCRPCDSESCRPSTCFPPAPLAAPGTSCPNRVLTGLGETPYLIVLPTMVRGGPLDGLPQFLTSPSAQTLAITPAAGRTRLGVVEIGQRMIPNDDPTGGESCGRNTLCGILEVAQFSGLPGWTFGFTGTLSYAAAF